MMNKKFLACSLMSSLILFEGCTSISNPMVYQEDKIETHDEKNSDEMLAETSTYVLGEAVNYSVEKRNIRVKENLPPETALSEIPKEKNITYFNQKTGKDEILPARLVETGVDDSTVWKEYVEFNWSFESENRSDE